ncbi:hypothetical protein ACFTSF_10490 [Kribbella sp. NPDC056951]|uniref:Uncharacterized protein n=1 Tax=Kribbella yunnanensis TaxID=190194 RepID=A0ABN2J3D2_9ACTN
MSEQESALAPDDVAQAGRVRLAEWLTAEAGNPELATAVEDLAAWPAYQAEEFLVFVPPGFANRIYLLAEHGITSFAPSEQTLDQAMTAARPQS